jgi:hypothetical protein
MTHMLSQLLRVAAPRAAPMLVVVEGAPRSGDATWAKAFTQRSADFAHLNIVSASRKSPTSNMIEVDEVTTLPLHSSGFQSCLPLVAVVDGDLVHKKQGGDQDPVAFSASTLSTKNLWEMTSGWNMCLSSINLLKGFSHMHRLALQPR